MEAETNTTPLQFKASVARFLARATPLRQLKSILCWENNTRSALVLLVYTFLCLYPILWLALPLAIFLGVTLYNEKRFIQLSNSPTSLQSTNLLRKGQMHAFELEENLIFLQSILNIYSTAYDIFNNILFKTKSKTLTQWTKLDMIFLATVLISLSLFIFLPWVFQAWSWLGWLVGWIILTAFSPLARYFISQLQDWIPYPPPTRATSPTTFATRASVSEKYVEVYENQRWWFGLGFQPLLLSEERAPWSNQAGTISLPPKESVPPPLGYYFQSTQWNIDLTWAPADDQGWVYMDHFWKNPTASPRMVSVTRSRKWVRAVVAAQ